MALTRARCSASFNDLICSVRQYVEPRWASGASEDAISSRSKLPHRRIGTRAAGRSPSRRRGRLCAKALKVTPWRWRPRRAEVESSQVSEVRGDARALGLDYIHLTSRKIQQAAVESLAAQTATVGGWVT